MAFSASAQSRSSSEEDDASLETSGGRGQGGKSLEAFVAMCKSRQQELQGHNGDFDSVNSADSSTFESVDASSTTSIFEATTNDASEDVVLDSESNNYASTSGTAGLFAPTPRVPHVPLPPMIHFTGDSTKFDSLSAYAASLLSSSPCNRQLSVSVTNPSFPDRDSTSPLAHETPAVSFLDQLNLPPNATPWAALSDNWDPGQASDSPPADGNASADSEFAMLLQAEIAVQKDANNAKFRRWTPQEDALLLMAVQEQQNAHHNATGIPFRAIAKKYFDNDRNGYQCKSRYRKIRPDVDRSDFTKEENDTILEMQRQGCTFADIAKQLENRTTDQVRSQFNDKLDPNLFKTKPWSDEEKTILYDAQKRMGNKWAAISKLLTGRSENDVKNHWHNAKTKQRRNMRKAMKAQVARNSVEAQGSMQLDEV